MTDFFAMGGYAAYVWPAYAVAALMMLTVLASTLRGLRAREATLKALEGSRPARRRERRTAVLAEPNAV
ncbi:heme exporter protein CcmD [Azospirillum sp. TSO22-1]|uniref:heme exporter protein CcmD n=1 Tax=Azospirillum sp. TSO22-1 TaxID=716789 RepID=UPI000D6120A4|nr:heme exporter protein CcmD [Azospirillum sp. TSO22-1]PWC31920.1 cytochrome C biogenesis protein CcmD [Azospirillum sp. TSO22-1]